MSQFTVAAADAQNEEIVLQRVDENNNPLATTGSVLIRLADCVDSSSLPHQLTVQEWEVCIDNGDGTFTKKHALFLSSAPY